MKNIIFLGSLVLILTTVGGCQRQAEVLDEQFVNSVTSVNRDDQETGTDQIEVEGVIVKDGDDLILIADGSQLPLASDDSLLNSVDQSVKIRGQYDQDGRLVVANVEIWKSGRLFQTVGNLYLLSADGDSVLLTGSVAPELTAKYLGREAKILGHFVEKSNFRFQILEYYIQGVKTDVWQIYENSQFGFSLMYPAGWEAKQAPPVNDQALTVVFSGSGETVELSAAPRIARPSAAQSSEANVILPSGLKVSLYKSRLAVDSAGQDQVIFKIPEKEFDLSISGSGAVFNQLFQTIELK
ncbi:MAG: hypothetical protein ACOZBH_03945 [Patescibacteria group bacterium]